MMKIKKISCFGKLYGERTVCKNCRWRVSCRVYEFSPNPDAKGGLMSYEKLENWYEGVADPSPLPGEEKDFHGSRISEEDLITFFKYILSVDKKTLSMIHSILSSYDRDGIVCSVKELADERGLTRQAVHAKILKTIDSRPELKKLFLMTLRHVSGIRKNKKHKEE